MKRNKKTCDWQKTCLCVCVCVCLTLNYSLSSPTYGACCRLSSVVCIIAFIYLLPAPVAAAAFTRPRPLPPTPPPCLAACDLCVAGVAAFIFAVFMSVQWNFMCALKSMQNTKHFVVWVRVLAKGGARLKVGNTYFYASIKFYSSSTVGVAWCPSRREGARERYMGVAINMPTVH